ncbi:gliding motility-associated C-terminal domain-containing protein [Panacibacter sp. DH6]|uniref:Gliding motility-associated C-terminal domain-containing protein n=1 Tax=Panacibacter microcysteis TaxID=2793269 RepID=A0A931GYS0_9BACT|nr:PKD domain-containing protein [Panacibacter microcysteis]MBG9377457.1 gliding motility-associated C-terminal domain-containing protein [Panacibacter microcysteis]
MKKIALLILFIQASVSLFASHIVGGEVFYTYLGPGTTAGTSRYMVSLRLFRDCNVPCNVNNVACLPSTAIVSIFTNAAPFSTIKQLDLPLETSQSLTLRGYPACISTRPAICYEVKTYAAEVTLTDNDAGYVLAYQNCCRADAANVLNSASSINGSPGVTYDCIMPGKDVLPSGTNSSATFNLKDTALVCYQSNFTLDFSARDEDGDSLSYEFVPAYQSNPAFTASNDQLPAFPPEYDSVDYRTGYSGLLPLGDKVSINSTTGIISGISPATPGKYVVAVIVKEWRNKRVIGEHRKDFIMRVENCNFPEADLAPSFITCDGFDLSFKNNSTSPIITSYYWDFGVDSTTSDTSNSPTPTFIYTDSGTYTVTLITNRGQQCTDTATTIAKVYPGFIPDFAVDGSCVLNPYQFTDKTTSRYGRVDSWRWDFGETTTLADTSLLQHPGYRYGAVQSPEVRLIVTNSKGCIDTVTKTLSISDKPVVDLAFRDTLICAIDTLLLKASSATTGITYTWSPGYNISDINIPEPLVWPKTTTVYNVTINNRGCIGTDSVKVNVISAVTLNLGPDTTICLTDPVQMFPNTNALYFSWSPANDVDDPSAKNPFITPVGSSSTYTLTATVGKCNATDNITIKAVPYPQVYAGADTAICYGSAAALHATTTAPNYAWSPITGLIRATTLTPSATPFTTTSYTITVSDVQGCPKPVSDTVVVNVIPPVPAFAGRDTVIVVNQPLQLNATGGAVYTWSPPTGMSDPNIPNPVVTLATPFDSIVYRVRVSTPEGCSATDDIKVTVFRSNPDIFVPSAFTPNGDGKNDIIRPRVIGIRQYNYFRVYNREGKMMYSTSTQEQGWDGSYGGQLQPPGAYVYMAQAIDYTGKLINKKGTVVLIR